MDYVPPGRAKSLCVANGGTWLEPNSRGVYGCVNDENGHGFGCGGDTASTRYTCGSW